MKPNLEYRSSRGIELNDAPKESGFIGTVKGYAVMFNSESLPMVNEKRNRPFIEKVAPGAFADTLAEKRDPAHELLALWAHDETRPLGRRGANLTVAEDERGLKFELGVPDTTTGRDLIANIKTGVVNGVSFLFKAIKEKFERGEEMDSRTIFRAKLFEVSPTVFPAYSDTSIDFRSHDRLCEQPAEVRALTIGDDGTETLERSEPAAPQKTPLRDSWALRLGLRR